MTEPFNVEKFRQQMRGQAPVAPQAVSAQMQAAPAAIPQAVPAQMQGVPAVMPQAMPQAVPQPYPAPQMQGQMAAQHAPQPMVPQPMAAPPMPQNPGFQPQPQAQPYSPPAAGQPQAWVPQGQTMQAPQVPQMMQPPVYATPPAAVDAPPLDEATSKKPRFSLKRLKKIKTPKIKKAAKAQTAEAEIDSVEGHKTKTSPAIIFMFGMATGIVCFLVGNMIMSNLFASKPTNNIADIAKRNASIQQPVLPTKQVGEAKALEAKAE